MLVKDFGRVVALVGSVTFVLVLNRRDCGAWAACCANQPFPKSPRSRYWLVEARASHTCTAPRRELSILGLLLLLWLANARFRILDLGLLAITLQTVLDLGIYDVLVAPFV